MTFSSAKRTDIITGLKNKEIGWIYTTDEGDLIIHYLDNPTKNNKIAEMASDRAEHPAS